MRNAMAKGFLALIGATVLFLFVLQFMPDVWKRLAERADLPKLFYDVMGFGGLTLIAMTVIALKSGMYGPRADKNPWFISLNTLGAFMHLVSFGHYYNPNGITLDAVYTAVGLYGLINFVALQSRYEVEDVPTGYAPPTFTRFLVIVGSVQLVLLAVVWFIWPGVMDVAQQFGEHIFHYAGNVAGIMILTCFFGQMFHLIDYKSWIFTTLYSIGIWGYVVNLTVEFNPYTVALELTLFIFFFYKLGKKS